MNGVTMQEICVRLFGAARIPQSSGSNLCLFWRSWWMLRTALRQMFARLVIPCAHFFWGGSVQVPAALGRQIHVVHGVSVIAGQIFIRTFRTATSPTAPLAPHGDTAHCVLHPK